MAFILLLAVVLTAGKESFAQTESDNQRKENAMTVVKTETTRKVLEGIADLSYQTSGECTFGGAVVACMKYIGNPTSYDFVMGVSGGAFKLMWHRQWCPSNNSLGILGHEPVRRAFRTLGYEHEVIDKGEADGLLL